MNQITNSAATDDECIELAQALEQLRAIKIVEAVAALPIGGASADLPTPFHAGFQLACEEITHRLKTEEWDLCLPPVEVGIFDKHGNKISGSALAMNIASAALAKIAP